MFIKIYGIKIRKGAMKSCLYQDLPGEIKRLSEEADA